MEPAIEKDLAHCSEHARELVKAMLEKNEHLRLDIDECLAHPWLQDGEKLAMTRKNTKLLTATNKLLKRRTGEQSIENYKV